MNIYQTAIIGAGPGGCSAAIYAARKKIKTLLITESFSGQSSTTAEIENWLGEKRISGHDLAYKFEQHVRIYKDIDIKEGESVEKIKRHKGVFQIQTSSKKLYQSKTLVIATGGRHRKLFVPGEDKFSGRGVVYCSTCDAPLFKNKTVVIVGTGNSGLNAAHDLLPYANKIYLLDISPKIIGDKILSDKFKNQSKIKFLLNSKIKEILGQSFVEGIKYTDKNKQEKTLTAQGVFVEIGMTPNTEFVKGLVELDLRRQIKVNHQTQATSARGIWAIGDVTDSLFKQNIISAGSGATAMLSINDYLFKK